MSQSLKLMNQQSFMQFKNMSIESSFEHFINKIHIIRKIIYYFNHSAVFKECPFHIKLIFFVVNWLQCHYELQYQGTLTEGEGSVQLTSSLWGSSFSKKVNNVFNLKSS
jgi:hypothetical protein